MSVINWLLQWTMQTGHSGPSERQKCPQQTVEVSTKKERPIHIHSIYTNTWSTVCLTGSSVQFLTTKTKLSREVQMQHLTQLLHKRLQQPLPYKTPNLDTEGHCYIRPQQGHWRYSLLHKSPNRARDNWTNSDLCDVNWLRCLRFALHRERKMRLGSPWGHRCGPRAITSLEQARECNKDKVN